jgi:hypothetical protein
MSMTWMVYSGVKSNLGVSRLTATGAYMHHRFSRALLELNNFLNFCPLATFDSSKCS